MPAPNPVPAPGNTPGASQPTPQMPVPATPSPPAITQPEAVTSAPGSTSVQPLVGHTIAEVVAKLMDREEASEEALEICFEQLVPMMESLIVAKPARALFLTVLAEGGAVDTRVISRNVKAYPEAERAKRRHQINLDLENLTKEVLFAVARMAANQKSLE